MLGKTVSHYRILSKLGEGGMGAVYKAEDLELKRHVALKFLPPHLQADETARKRFINEAQAASALEHPNICSVYEIDTAPDGQTFIVMPCYEGYTLRQRLAEGPPLPVEEALDIADQVAAGLSKAHAQGIVHRDIKPANIFITDDDRVVILDFGLAKLAKQTRVTRTGTTVGTVAYMSPEQTRGDDVEARSDVWSLGVVLYEMLAGRAPFRGDAEPAVANSILHDQPEMLTAIRRDVPSGVEDVVERALAKDSAKRFEDAGEMREAVVKQRQLLDMGLATRRSVRWKRFRRNKRAVSGVSALAVIVLAVIATLFFYQPSEALDSLAVLPVEFIGATTLQDTIAADAMTIDLSLTFSRLGVSKVISWRSSMMYKDTGKSPQQIGAELDVQSLVASTMQRTGNEMKITIELIESSTGRSLWSGVFEGQLSDALRLQNRIALSVADAIELELTPNAERVLAAAPEVDPDAWEAYQQGIYFQIGAGGRFFKSREYFERAIELDSTFARAYAHLAEWYIATGHDSIPAGEYGEKAKRYALKSLELDPDLAEGHAALGHILWEYDFDMERAQLEFDRAMEIDPTYSNGYIEYAHFLLSLARYEEAADVAIEAAKLDPVSLRAQFLSVSPMREAGRYDEALAQINKAVEIFPDYKWYGDKQAAFVYQHRGQWDRAVAIFDTIPSQRRDLEDSGRLAWLCYMAGQGERAIALTDSLDALTDSLTGESVVPPLFLGVLWATRGDSTKAAGYLRQAETKDLPPNYYLFLAFEYAQIGDFDRAFYWIEWMYENRVSWLTRLRDAERGLNAGPIVNDPRYWEWVEKLNLDT
jgi:serine/threonine-protein kinase